MSASLPERLSVVETKLCGIEKQVKETATDVRAIRDHLLTEKGAKNNRARTFTIAGSLILGGATLWETFRGVFKI